MWQGMEVVCQEELYQPKKLVKNPSLEGPPLAGPIWPRQGEPALGKGLSHVVFQHLLAPSPVICCSGVQ